MNGTVKKLVSERFESHPLFNGLQCGMNFGSGDVRGDYSRPEMQKQPEQMRKIGVNLVILNSTICQESYYSRKLFLDFSRTPGEMELADMVKSLHDQGIRVILRPSLISLDGVWKNRIYFRNDHQIQEIETFYYDDWFKSYSECLNYYADFAEAQQVDALLLGSTTYYAEYKNEPWHKTILAIRERYSGPISYEVFPNSFIHGLDWVKETDFLSLSYFPFAPQGRWSGSDYRKAPSATPVQMAEYIQPGLENIRQFSIQQAGKPFLLTSTGAPSLHGHIYCPYSFSDGVYFDQNWQTFRFLPETGPDQDEQASFMEAMFRAVSALSGGMGLCWWKWDPDSAFSIAGKSAEKVFSSWAAQLKTDSSEKAEKEADHAG